MHTVHKNYPHAKSSVSEAHAVPHSHTHTRWADECKHLRLVHIECIEYDGNLKLWCTYKWDVAIDKYKCDRHVMANSYRNEQTIKQKVNEITTAIQCVCYGVSNESERKTHTHTHNQNEIGLAKANTQITNETKRR